MAKTNRDLLAEITAEASGFRGDTASVKSNLKRKGEETEPDQEADIEQDLETKEVPDEEPEEDFSEKTEPEEEVEDEEEESKPRKNKEEESDELTPSERNRINALRRINREKDERIRELEGKVEEFKSSKTQSEQKEIGDEIVALADELKLDPDGLKKIFTTFETIVERKVQSQLPPKELINDFEERQEQAFFDKEWNDTKVQDYIEQTYPNATAKQLKQAKALLDELAHDPDFGGRVVVEDGRERLAGYPLEYVMWNHKEEFDVILNTKKRHGLESAGTATADGGDLDESVDRSSSKGIDALDKKYADASDSGLRRVRPGDRGSL